MKVSVMIPMYNAEKTIRRTLLSILEQTYTDLEILLVDDGCTDKTISVVQSFQDPRIRLIQQANGGVASARNTALDHATGDFFLFVDADDRLSCQAIEAMVQASQKYQADLVCCGYQMHIKGVPVLPSIAKAGIYTPVEAIKLMVNVKGMNNYPWAKLMARHLWEGIRFPQVACFEDAYTLFKVFHRANIIAQIKGRYYHYIWRSGSLTNRMGIEKVYEMRRSVEYQQAELGRLYPQVHFLFNDQYYNCEMVILYTLFFVEPKKRKIRYRPSTIQWDQVDIFRRLAHTIALRCVIMKHGINCVEGELNGI